MKHIKGGTSRFLGQTMDEERVFKWQEGYGVFSVSPQDRDKVIRYISNQKEHHANGTLWLTAEKTADGE
jgi:putative transposase